jgi:hypothetical protein
MRRGALARAWPAVALVTLLGATFVQVRTGRVWNLATPVFIGSLFVACIGGWLIGLLLQQAVARRRGSGGASAPIAASTGSIQLTVTAISILVAAALVGAFVWRISPHSTASHAVQLGATVGAAFAAGGFARLAFGSRAVVTQLVLAAAVAIWGYYDTLTILHQPFRDVKLYLTTGTAWLDGQPVYLREPLTAMPADWTKLPYVYPPFLLPLFGALSRLPHGVVIAVWEVLAVAAVILAFKLLGVRNGWLPILFIWPPVAVGLSVGNAAPFGFLGLAAGWRWGPALVLGGVFKIQAAIPSLWLLRERRWRSFALGCAIAAALMLVTLPLTGLAIYGDWLRGLAAFEGTVRRIPLMQGSALQRYLPSGLAIGLAVLAVVASLLASGRMGLSRFGLAAVVASPTLYVHGLTFVVPAALWLDAAGLWLVMGLVVPLGWGLWLAIAALMIALMLGRTREATATDSSLLHPLGAHLEPWPDA